MDNRITSRSGATVSYASYGSGPPLVLVHGAFSDHRTNWEFVAPMLREHFAVFAIARRGRGETPATSGHSLHDEVADLVTLIQLIEEPVFLLGHSYGAHCALAAAAVVPERVRRLVLYEPASPDLMEGKTLARLELLGAAGRWDELAFTFFRDALFVPVEELTALRASELWPPIVADARASLEDLRALSRYDFAPDRFASLDMPVLLQVGTESVRHLYVTDALAAVLPDVRIEALPEQAHEGMTTAPRMYADRVIRFLRPDAVRSRVFKPVAQSFRSAPSRQG
jgi:pimeloyl-ACP methyl ester carboxylesterase